MTIAPLFEGFKFYFQSVKKYTSQTAPIFILLGLLSASSDILLNSEMLFTWGILIFIFTNVFLSPFLTAFSILLVSDLYNNSLKESIGYYLVSFQICLKVLLLTLATGAIVVVGLILFIVPGVYLASRLLYGPYYLIIEGKTVIQAMDLSWSSTKEKSMDYMTILFFYWTTLIIVTFLVLTTISAFVISSGEGSLPFLINVIANTFLSYLQLVLISYPIFYVYKNMDSNF